jgi:hypothetical protein
MLIVVWHWDFVVGCYKALKPRTIDTLVGFLYGAHQVPTSYDFRKSEENSEIAHLPNHHGREE